MSDQAPTIPAGWYPDPSDASRARYWDGAAWTAHVHPPVTTASPQDARWSTPWIWLAIFAPLPLTLASYLLLLAFPFDAIATPADPEAATRELSGTFASPGWIAVSVLGNLVPALTVLFAGLDYRTLRRRGIPKPFHWAFGFFALIGYPVYPIGRGIVTRLRTGRGIAVTWVAGVVFVVTLAVGILASGIFFLQFFQAFLDALPTAPDLR